MTIKTKILPLRFYQQDTVTVARDLLGKILLVKHNDKTLAAKIVETEAYLSVNDPACHAARGMTKRNSPMFENGGIAYVYFTYGMYFCFNVVTAQKDQGEAVLIRAAEPIANIDQMYRLYRDFDPKKPKAPLPQHLLLSGPGRLTRGLGINLAHNRRSLTRDRITIATIPQKNETTDSICVSGRIGISKGADLPLRFYLADSPSVSVRPSRRVLDRSSPLASQSF